MAGVGDIWQHFNTLTEAKNDSNIARSIASLIDTDKWIVEDGHISAAHELLQHTLPKRISLELSRNPGDLNDLPHILQHISTLQCNLELRFHRHFQEITSGDNDYTDTYFLPLINKSCHIRVIKGSLSVGSAALIPDSVLQLHLCIYSDESAIDLNNLKLTQLRENGVGLHILRKIDPSYIPSFPYNVFALYLSQLSDSEEDADWAAEAAFALQKGQRWEFNQIRIADATLTLEGTKRLLQKMNAKGVKLKDRNSGGIIQISSFNLTENDKAPLKLEAKSLWNCFVSIKEVTCLMAALGEDF